MFTRKLSSLALFGALVTASSGANAFMVDDFATPTDAGAGVQEIFVNHNGTQTTDSNTQNVGGAAVGGYRTISLSNPGSPNGDGPTQMFAGTGSGSGAGDPLGTGTLMVTQGGDGADMYATG